MPLLPYTPDTVAQARAVVTRFDAILDDNGPVEAGELRATAWDILIADHAARIAARRRAGLRIAPHHFPGDAA